MILIDISGQNISVTSGVVFVLVFFSKQCLVVFFLRISNWPFDITLKPFFSYLIMLYFFHEAPILQYLQLISYSGFFHHGSDIHSNIHIFMIIVPLSFTIIRISISHIFVIIYSYYCICDMAPESLINICFLIFLDFEIINSLCNIYLVMFAV